MTDSLQVKIKKPFLLTQILELSASRLGQILQLTDNFKVACQIPRGVSFSVVPIEIPAKLHWGLYFYIEEVAESLVEARLSTIGLDDTEQRPVVIQFEERRTLASQALTAALAIAGAELLEERVLDFEHRWTTMDSSSPTELRDHLTIPGSEPTLKSALESFGLRMNRK